MLVVSDGSGTTEAIASRLTVEGVPYDRVNLPDVGRPVITAGFLADTVGGVERAKYQAVVLPNDNPFTDPAELTALADYERHFGIRQVDSYLYPSVNVGLNPPFYAGQLDGITAAANATGTAAAGPFRYLRGPVPFEDNDKTVAESYGFPAQPLTGAPFIPLVTGPPPGGGASGVLIGQYDGDGRSQLVITFSYNSAQQQFGLLAHGIVTWMTRGVHLGHDRQYFSVNVDDVFLPDARWSVTGNCTPGEDCTGGQTTPDIRMKPVDVIEAYTWQQNHNFTFDFMFNGFGSVEAAQQSLLGIDLLTTVLVTFRGNFRWTNHTYAHEFLGCVQDLTVRPWRCTTDPATGAVVWVPQSTIQQQISDNLAFASAHGLPVDRTELVTGEHSGMRILPQQPDDNPNLAPAVAATGVKWLGSDHSRDPGQRAIGPALTVSRYPMNVYFNVARVAEEVDEYNWIYTSRANGGSGICEDNPATTTCITPLSANGYATYIVPLETRIALSHILGNDPRPHYVHQSNLTEGQILYPLLNSMLSGYRNLFAANAPIVCERLSANGETLRRQAAWAAAVQAGTVGGYVRDGVVTITAPAGLDVPVTVPNGTRVGTPTGAAFGNPYGGERSAWWHGDGTPLTLAIPA
ncbi:MAG: hypothetical protein AUI14_13105 [Actinobacteria bacterium 13_2_20CM_2_71_6]|nr:MAG: hypothetical protein AUI14_13105 [Actinobacteria bacterium 13_2_20CM_2_71_6]